MKKFLWLGLILLMAFIGCNLVDRDFSLAEEDFIDPNKGSLVLVFDDSELPTKTIAPPASDMVVGRYEIRGSGPLGDSFEDLTNTSGVLTVNGLTPGSWTLQVEAFNSGGLEIGAIGGVIAQTIPFTITAALVTTFSVDIIPISGTGTLDLTITWPTGSVSNPTVAATLTPYGITTPATITFTPGSPPIDTASYSDSARLAGYYYLMLQLIEDGSPVAWGHFEAVRVIYQQTTSRPFSLNMDAGGLYLQSIIFDKQNPVAIAFIYNPTPLPATLDISLVETLEVTADPTPADTLGNYTYQWYADGIAIGTATTAASGGDSITLEAVNYSPGDHNFTVLIDDTANGTLSSESFSIEIVN